MNGLFFFRNGIKYFKYCYLPPPCICSVFIYYFGNRNTLLEGDFHLTDRLLPLIFQQIHPAVFLSCIDKWCESRLVMVVSWVLNRVSPCLSPCFHGFLFLVIYSHSGLWLTDGILLTVLVTLNLQHLLRVKTSQRGSVSCGRGWPVWVCWELWPWLTSVGLWAVVMADVETVWRREMGKEGPFFSSNAELRTAGCCL